VENPEPTHAEEHESRCDTQELPQGRRVVGRRAAGQHCPMARPRISRCVPPQQGRREITPEPSRRAQMEGAENRRSSMKKNKVTQNYFKFLVLTKSKSDFLEILKIIY